VKPEVLNPMMRFSGSISDAILNRSSEELIGALLIAASVAIVTAGVYALRRKKAPPSATFVGGLVLASGVSCMALVAGYIEYAAGGETSRSRPIAPPLPVWPPIGTARSNSSGPSGFSGAGWSSGLHVVLAADEDHDGRLTPEEVAHMVRDADTDRDGSVDFRDIDRLMLSRFRALSRPRRAAAPVWNRLARGARALGQRRRDGRSQEDATPPSRTLVD
jgi:hypothetical protein